MSYRVINTVTGRIVHYDHTYAGCDVWIRRQRHPPQFRIEEND